MKKIILSLTSFLLLCATHFASAADTKINAGGINKPYYIANGCAWKLNGTGAWGNEYGLVCNGVYAATKTPNGYSSTPFIITASSGFYVTTYSGTTPLSSVNDYDYAIYKLPTPPSTCPASSIWTKGPYSERSQAESAYNMSVFYKTCPSNCRLEILPTSSTVYNVACH